MRLLATSSLLYGDPQTGRRILFLAGMFEAPQKLLYIKSEMVSTKLFKENL